jgi:hypothetical protein
VPTTKITYSVADLDECSTAAADSYFEFTFAADIGVLTPGNHLKFSFAATNTASQMFIQTGDYSYDVAQMTSSDYSNVVILNSAGVVWGAEP